MLGNLKDWFGYSNSTRVPRGAGHDRHHGHGHPHGHSHGAIDPGIASSERGIWAIKWSFAILAVTAALQIAVVLASGSVALLADAIHNIGDATTAIPLWVAFVLARRPPSARFTYGLGRVEDLAGVLIVLIILFSAGVAAYQAISRLVQPQPVTHLGWLVAAGLVGFLGNEIVAVLRIRVGREMNSVALIADGYHARTDGLTSLAVVGGAIGVWLGFPLADPLVGLAISVVILGIVWQSGRAVLTRMLDGVEPDVTDTLHHAAGHVSGIRILDARARWLGHDLHADLDVALEGDPLLSQATALSGELERSLRAQMPALSSVTMRFQAPARPPGIVPASAEAPTHGSS